MTRQRPINPRRSMLVDGDLPIEELAVLAVRESRRPRAVYQTHKWFARRFGSAFRGLLTACTLEAGDDFWSAYLGGASLEGWVVMDPFVGGGTTVGEAQRMGATCLASDVDPVAVSITRFQSQLGSVPELDPALAELSARVGSDLSRYHETTDASGETRRVLHHFFVQAVGCRACGETGYAHPHHQLAHDGSHQWVFCRGCGQVHTMGPLETHLRCVACGFVTDVGAGSSRRGLYRCVACGTEERLIDLAARTGRPPTYKPFAVEYIGDDEGGRPVPMSRRFFKAASNEDAARYEAASARLRLLDLEKTLPGRLIPTEQRVDDRLLRYGYRTYLDLFNDRQRLHLALLKAAIADADETCREALAIAFCDHLKTNCMLTTYAFGWRRLAPLFSIRAFRHVSRPVEINPWLCGTGRGTYPNAVRRIQRAQAWLRDPREPAPGGGVAPADGPRPKSGAVETVVASAGRLRHAGDASVDLVVTDPPYFDNIAYSELSDFFLPWHAAFGLVEGAVEGFPRDRLRATRGDDASMDAFAGHLSLCFAEIARALKRKGLLIFTFQHKTRAGWYALGKALAQGGLRTLRVFPMLGDTDAGPHKHPDSIRWDAVIVAVRSDKAPGATAISSAARDWAHATSSAWIERLSGNSAFPFKEADAENLRRACIAAAASHGSNAARAKRSFDIYDLLKAEVRFEGGASATAFEEGAVPVREDAVQPTAAPQPVP